MEIGLTPQLESLPCNELQKANSLGPCVLVFYSESQAFRRRKFNSFGACLDFILNQSSHAKGLLIRWQPAADAFSTKAEMGEK